MKSNRKKAIRIRVRGVSAAAAALGVSAQHVSQVARGNRSSRRVEAAVRAMCVIEQLAS